MAQLILGGLGALIIALGFQTWRIDNLKDKARGYNDAIETLDQALQEKQKSIDECKQIAAENLAEAERQRLAAQDAAWRVNELRELMDLTLEDIANDSESLQIKGGCPAADDPAYGDWLYNSTQGRHGP